MESAHEVGGRLGVVLALAREFNVLGATATIMQFSEMTPACAAESATTRTTTTMTLMTTTMAMAMTMTMIITMMIMIITMMTTLAIVSTAVPQRRIAFERQ